jgi:hypothetical protein
MGTRRVVLVLVVLVVLLVSSQLLSASPPSAPADFLAVHLAAPRAPVTGHPRLWLRAEDLPRLRAWAVNTNPIYRDGLVVLAAQAKADMDAGRVPGQDGGSTSYEQYPSEMYAELFAFMSLISSDQATRNDYAQRARTLLMHVINEAAKGAASGQPFRDPRFSISDRSRWQGEAFGLTVDWIYPYLSTADKTAIRQVFLRWADENTHAETTSFNHPEPIGVMNDPILVSDTIRVRWSANNYYTAHARNLGLMALALDAADDPGNTLRNYLDSATGAWLYVIDTMLRRDAQGGLAPEGFEYSPQAVGYVLQLLLALHTAGQDDPATRGPQVVLTNNPFWSDLLPAYFHSLSPRTVPYPYLGTVYQPAWYGDGQNYWSPDFIGAFGPLGLYDYTTSNATRLAAIRWAETHTAPGGATRLMERVADADAFHDAILYFMLFDPADSASSDPRPSLPLIFYAPGIGHILARTGWDADAAWFTYSLGWNSIDHQHGDGNHFEFYRRGEWLTKDRTGYGVRYSASDNHNTLALQNDSPAHNAEDDYRHMLWQRGSQWLYTTAADGRILAHSSGQGFVYALGDATGLYNSDYEGSNDITHASRSIVWLQPDHIVVYDRATSQTAGRFKRFWLQLPAQPGIIGNRATITTTTGQHLFVTSLLPANAVLASVPPDALDGTPANEEPMQFRLRVEAPGEPADVRFLHVLQGADAVATADPVTLIQSSGTPFAGTQVRDIAVLFPMNLSAPFTTLVYTVTAGTSEHLITGLASNGGYNVITQTVGSHVRVTINPGTAYHADSGGVLTLGVAAQENRKTYLPWILKAWPAAPTPTPTQTRTPGSTLTPTPTRTRTPGSTPTPTRTPVASATPTPSTGGSGHITYRADATGHVYRLAAQAGATPQDMSLALNALSSGSDDRWLNTSPDGQWLVLDTDRFDPECAGWTCLAIVNGDLLAGEAVRANGELVHPEGFSAVASGGHLIVYPARGITHTVDLWAVTRNAAAWNAPVLLTGDSPYAYNHQPAISANGGKVVFDCGNAPYGAQGTAICEVNTDGTEFRVVLTPAGSPAGFPKTGALHHPDYAPDGSIVFEADWAGEQIWRLPMGSTVPARVNAQFGNDNSPCVLPDGRIASLWLNRPSSSGFHEIKVMASDGSSYIMVLINVDVLDGGIGCGV